MADETAAATVNPTPDASASSDASATSTATAASEAGKQTQTSETQTQQATETPANESKTTTESAAAAVPEKYEFKAPEGSEYDPGVLETFAGAAKEAGLSQDAAQKVLEKMAPALVARQNNQVQAIHKEWADASAADKEFGGDKLKENLGIARKAYDAFDPIPQGQTTTPLRTLLETTGLGNHPEMIRLLYRAGKAISEDKFVGGNATSSNAKNPASVLYDKTTKG